MRRYEIRNEYGAGEVDLYKSVDKDDPEMLLEGIAMAGLVGVLRQLGDLAEFAAEIFHDLHEDVMATAARGHDLMARVHQLEAEVPFVEKSFVTESHRPFLSNPGVGWHANINIEHNTITQGNLPRFVMDSCEECRGPPRLFLLDKFDVAGAGACLKRYTDPALFKAQAEAAQIANVDKKSRKIKKKPSRWRRGDNPESVISSNTTLHDLLSKDFVKPVHSTPTPNRLLKIKRKFSNGNQIDGTNYLEKFRETILLDSFSADADEEFSNLDSYGSGLDIHEINVMSPVHGKELVVSSFHVNQGESGNEVRGGNTDRAIVKFSESMSEMGTDESSLKNGLRSEDTNSEMGVYLDALASVEYENESNIDLPLMLVESSKPVTHAGATFSDSRSFGHSSVSYEWDTLPSKSRNSFDDLLSNTSDLRLRELRTPDGDEFSSSSSHIDAPLSMASGDPEMNKTAFDPTIKSCSLELGSQVECSSVSERVMNNDENESRSSQHFARSNESSSEVHDVQKKIDTTVVSNSKKMDDLESEFSIIGVSHSLVSFPFVTSLQEVNANIKFGNAVVPSDIKEDLSTIVASKGKKVSTNLDNGVVATSEFREGFSSKNEKDGESLGNKVSVSYSEIRENLHSLVASDMEVGASASSGAVVLSDTRDDLHSLVASNTKVDTRASSGPYSDIPEDLHSFVPSIGRKNGNPNDNGKIAHPADSYQNHRVSHLPYHQKLQDVILSKDVKIIADERTKQIDFHDKKSLFSVSDVAQNKIKASSSLEWKTKETTERFVDLGGKISSLHDMNGAQSESIGSSVPQNKNEVSEPKKMVPAGSYSFSCDMASLPSFAVPAASSFADDLPPLPPLPPIEWRTGKVPLFMQPSVSFGPMNESVPASDLTHKNINRICVDADHIPVNEKEIACDFDDDQNRLNISLLEHSNIMDIKSSQENLSLGTPDLKFRFPEFDRKISREFDDEQKRLNSILSGHSSIMDVQSSQGILSIGTPNLKFQFSELGREISSDFDDEQKRLNSSLPEHSNIINVKSSQRDPSLGKFPLSELGMEISSDFDGEKQRLIANQYSSDENSDLINIRSSQKSEAKVQVSDSGKVIACDFDTEEQKFTSDLSPPHEDSLNLDIKSLSNDINLETPDVKFPPFDSEKEASYDSVGQQKKFYTNDLIADVHSNLTESKSLPNDLSSETPDTISGLSESEKEFLSDQNDGQENFTANLPIHQDNSTLTTPQLSENNRSSELIIRHSNSANELPLASSNESHENINIVSIKSSQEEPTPEINYNVSHSSGNKVSRDVEQMEIGSNLPSPHDDTDPTDIKSLGNDFTSDFDRPKADDQEVLPSGSTIKPNEMINTLSLPPTFGVGKLNRSKQSLPRNPLIDAAAAVDKSKMRKVTKHERPHPPPSLTERDSLQLKKVSGKSVPKIEQRDSLLEQIRTKSFNLKPASTARSTIQSVPAPKTNLKVAAILEKANAIRQALAGSDESDDSGDWEGP